MHDDYMPKTYQPIVPPRPTIPVPKPFQSPPKIQPPNSPSSQPVVHPASSGNGEVWCSGPSSPGYNVNTGKCSPISTTTNAVVPSSQVIQLRQLPYTGDSSSDAILSALFYVAIIAAACTGIYYWKRIMVF